MVVAEGPKIFVVQRIWGKIFVYLGQLFVFEYSRTIFHIVFRGNKYGKSVFWAHFFERPYRSNGTKVDLDAALAIHFFQPLFSTSAIEL